MKKTITQQDFVQAFDDYNRSEKFTVQGREALYDYIEDLYCDIGDDYELDVIELCYNFTEYQDLEEYNADHEEVETVEEINDLTVVIMIDEESFIIQSF